MREQFFLRWHQGFSLTIHLHQELVKGILPLVVPPEPSLLPSLPPHGINLIDKDNAGGVLPSLAEEIPHPGRPHTHKHLQKL